jgi:hypothetical protein
MGGTGTVFVVSFVASRGHHVEDLLSGPAREALVREGAESEHDQEVADQIRPMTSRTMMTSRIVPPIP